MDDFEKSQARAAAKDLWLAFTIGHEQTAWTEEESFVECVSCALLEPLQRVGTLIKEMGQLRNHLIRWDNGNVTCLVCGHGTHGGQRIPHDDDCVMAGYTKRSYHGPAILCESHTHAHTSEER